MLTICRVENNNIGLYLEIYFFISVFVDTASPEVMHLCIF
jgi:hypothetical protein